MALSITGKSNNTATIAATAFATIIPTRRQSTQWHQREIARGPSAESVQPLQKLKLMATPDHQINIPRIMFRRVKTFRKFKEFFLPKFNANR
jgi:hypothetical protein